MSQDKIVAREEAYLSGHWHWVGALFGEADRARLEAWRAEARRIQHSEPSPAASAIAGLESRLAQLESLVKPVTDDEQKTGEMLDALLDGLLGRLIETITPNSQRRPSVGDILLADYCEFLWQKAVDEITLVYDEDFDREQCYWEYGRADKLSRLLELLRNLVQASLKAQPGSISRCSPSGWNWWEGN